jgi:hypothetical protein
MITTEEQPLTTTTTINNNNSVGFFPVNAQCFLNTDLSQVLRSFSVSSYPLQTPRVRLRPQPQNSLLPARTPLYPSKNKNRKPKVSPVDEFDLFSKLSIGETPCITKRLTDEFDDPDISPRMATTATTTTTTQNKFPQCCRKSPRSVTDSDCSECSEDSSSSDELSVIEGTQSIVRNCISHHHIAADRWLLSRRGKTNRESDSFKATVNGNSCKRLCIR